MPEMKKPRNTKKTVLQLFKYMMRHKFLLIIACICSVTAPVFTARATFLLKPAINDGIIPLFGQPDPDFSPFVKILVQMAVMYVGAALTSFFQTLLMTKLCHETVAEIREDLFAHMQQLPLSYFDTVGRGKVMSAYSSDLYTLMLMLKMSVPQILSGVVSIVSIIASMLILNVSLTAFVAAYLVIVVVVNRFVVARTARYTKNTQESIREMNGFIEEMVEGQNVIRLFTKEDDMRSQFRKQSEELYGVCADAKTFTNIIYPVNSGVSNLGFTAVAVFGVFLIIRGLSDVGSVCAFIQYYRQFGTPVLQVSQQVSNVFSALAGAERIFVMLSEDCEVNEGGKVLEENTVLRTGIVFKDVDFGYSKDRPVLKDFSLEITPGQRVAFVGASGAGKSTIAGLIDRFYDIDGGCITYDGTDIRDIDKYCLRKKIAVVLQDTHLFTGTIMENIRFGRPEASDEEVRAAAKMANADFFIEHLPEKYDTVLEADGTMLSDGQRQLIAIARAAVSKAPILILDEATSLLDTRTEKMIEDGLCQLMKSKTVFMIAHRLSSVKNADVIVVLKDGAIAERGTHEELMKKRGVYFALNRDPAYSL